MCFSYRTAFWRVTISASDMGNFGGHALPGSFFIIFGLWWTVQIFRRYFASQRKGAIPYKSSVTYPLDFICCGPKWLRLWEWEGFIKIFFTLVGFILEIITAHKDGRFTHFGNGQHATMFFFFGLYIFSCFSCNIWNDLQKWTYAYEQINQYIRMQLVMNPI